MEVIFRYFAKNHKLAMLMSILVLMVGSYSLLNINRDINPQVDFGRMVIVTVFPGASPQDVELNVTNKIEKELKTVSGLKWTDSVSLENRSEIYVFIDDDIKNQEKVKDEVRRAVDQVTDLPPEVEQRPKVVDLNSSVFPVIEVGIGGEIEYSKLRILAKNLKRRLENIPGVSRLDPFSYRAREVKVEVSPEKVKDYNIPLEQIYSAIRNRNVRASGGHFESYVGQKNVVTLSQFKSPSEVGDVIVKSNFEGIMIQVKDLAVVKDDFKKGNIISKMNGKLAVSFVVYKKEYADIVKTVEQIKKLVNEEKKNLPEGVSFSYSNDVSRLVKNRFEIVASNGAIGLALVLVLLSFFLNYRTAFWVSLGIPISVCGVVFLLKATGHSLDAIGLSAIVIVIGIIVDDAIIISENIYRHFDELGKKPIDAAVDGIKEVFFPVLTTILTTMLAFGPMFFMSGLMGKFIYIIPLVITFALVVSLIEACFFLPSHIAHGLHRSKKKEKENWFVKIKKPFSKFIVVVLKHRYISIGVFLLSLAGSVFYFTNYMNFILFPASTAERIYLRTELAPGTSLKANGEKLKEIERLVSNIPKKDLSSFVTRIGVLAGQHGYFRPGISFGTIEINLTPFGKRKRTALEITNMLREQTSKLKGYNSIKFEIAEGGPPVGRPISINVVGSDDEKRKVLAGELMKFLNTIEGVKDVDSDDKFGKDEIHVDLKYPVVARYGLSVSQVANTIRMAIDGMIATDVRYQDEDVDFRVILNEKARIDEKNIGNLLISNNFGKVIPLKKVANFSVKPGVDEIRHYDGERSLSVVADVEKGVVTPVEAIKRVNAHFNLNRDWPGLKFHIGGEADETAKSIINLLQTFTISAVGIYFLLILLFNSLLQPFYVLIAIPFGLIGVILAFAAHGEPLSFLAALGIIGLAGVVVNDSLVLVDHINQLRKKFPDKNIVEIVAIGTTNRLRAIIITTLTTVAGLLPLAYGIGGVDMFMVPMALSMGYGLLFATLLTLFLVPCIYAVGDDLINLFRKKEKITTQEVDFSEIDSVCQ
jgi:multidrug efflux pump subunit AcrB